MSGGDTDSLVRSESKRLSKMFDTFDADKDGCLTVDEIISGLHKMGYYHVKRKQIEEYMEKADDNHDGTLDLVEFVTNLMKHEKHLKFLFSSVDENKDGHLSIPELIVAFDEVGIIINEEDAKKLIGKRSQSDGSINVTYEEWRDMLLFAPSSDTQEILKYWREASIFYVNFVDYGDNSLGVKEAVKGMWWRHLLAGGLAGAISRTITAPVDRLKVFLQVHGGRKELGIVDTVKYMLKDGGVKGLWRGNLVNVIKIAPESALKFGIYEMAKQWIRGEEEREIWVYERFLAGSFAGATSQSIIYPLELLKTRMILRKTGQYDGIFDCAKKLYKADGLKVFYKGYVPNLLGIIPYAGIDLAVYETLKKACIDQSQGSPNVLLLLSCGSVSSCCGQLATYPLALIRTKLQSQAGLTHKLDLHPSQRNMVGLFRFTWKNEGLRGLYRGIVPNFMKVAPAVSISYYIYERTRGMLGIEMS